MTTMQKSQVKNKATVKASIGDVRSSVKKFFTDWISRFTLGFILQLLRLVVQVVSILATCIFHRRIIILI